MNACHNHSSESILRILHQYFLADSLTLLLVPEPNVNVWGQTGVKSYHNKMQTDQNKFVTSSPKDYEMRFIRVWPLSFPVYDLSSWSQYPNTKVKMRYQYHHGDMMTKELRVIVTSELLLCVIQDLIFSEISECLWYLRYLKWTLSEQPLWTRVKVRGPATFSCSHSLLLDLTHIPNTRHDEAWHWAL